MLVRMWIRGNAPSLLGNANLYNLSGNQSAVCFLRKLEIVQLEDSAIPLLGIY